MATTYSTSLKLALIGDGDQSGIWGQTTNTNLGTLVEQAITGVQTIVMSDANYTLTSFNGTLDEARNAVLVVTGTNSAVRDLIPPLVKKTYTIVNNTTGGFAIRVIGASGTGVNIPNGATCLVYCNGTNFVTGLSGTSGNFLVNGALTVTSTSNLSGATTIGAALTYGGVTLSNAVTGTGSMVLSASPALTGTPTSTTAAVGTNTTQVATTAFVQATLPSGVIVMWSGSIASIPTGWLLCNGSNGTPDLRDRFVLGAGGAYSVSSTGGSANATLVSHTHTASVADPGHFHESPIVTGANDGFFGYGATFPGIIGASQLTEKSTLTQTKATGVSVTNSTEGSSPTNANMPPYYALAYIMKS
jgi:hypothetical protein